VIDQRLLICAVCSVVGHFAIAQALDTLPQRERDLPPRTVEVRVVSPPPRIPEPPPPPPPPPEPPPEPAVAPPPKPTLAPPKPVPARPQPTPSLAEPAPTPGPATPNAPVVGTPGAKPVFGVAMESSPGTGPALPTGNTTTPQPAGPTTGPAKPISGGATPAHEVTRMPLPQGRCAGKYTDAAREAGLEGVVVLDLVVDASGKATDIKVVEGLDHGLTEAAIAALRACRFSPGEKDGTAVAVRVRGFKIRFVLDAQ